MPGFTDYWSKKILDHSTGKNAVSMPTVYIGLFTAVPTDAGGGTEVSGNGYARVGTSASTWNSASGSDPSSTSNSASITFPTDITANWGSIVAIGAFDALTSGNLLWWDYTGNFPWLPTTVSSASPGVFTAPAHGFSNGDSGFWDNEYGGTAPSLSAGSFTGVLTVQNVTTDTFTLENVSTALNTSSTGNGMFRKTVPLSVVVGNTPILVGGTPGDCQLTLA